MKIDENKRTNSILKKAGMYVVCGLEGSPGPKPKNCVSKIKKFLLAVFFIHANIANNCIQLTSWVDFITSVLRTSNILQKQPPGGVPRKRCSENMQQIYRGTPMFKV